jgi:hypothetical protein
MNRIFSLLTVSTVSIFLLSSTCKKDSPDSNGPDVVLPTSGFLVTMGINREGYSDTLTYLHSTIGQELTMYGYGLQRPDDEIRLINYGDGTMAIERKVPYIQNSKPYNKFGVEENTSPVFSSFPDHKYLFYFYHEQHSVLTRFTIKRKDGDMEKFTIESKAYPGYFLGCAKWKNAVYPTQTRLVLTTKAQEFWFIQR